jgi:deoxycytidine triphosphate deaminase
MTIKSDRWIRRMAAEQRMIEPFEPGQIREANGHKIVSYGTSSYGYDIRCSNEFKLFTDINSTIVDPKNFDEKSFVDIRGEYCIIPPNSFALARTIEYFRVPRNVLVVCLGKSTYARCFRGDTRVALVDGRFATLEDMARRADSGELFWGYSIGENGRIVVSLLDAPRYVGRDCLLEIELDNGEIISATPDHDFMLRDGRMLQAASLLPGQSLMPLYRELTRGYEMVYQPLNGRLIPTHRLADEWNLRRGIYPDTPGTHRHHIDFDLRNNRPVNIERIGASDHIRLHNEESYGEDFDRQAHGAAIREALSRLAVDPAWMARFVAAQRQRARTFWTDPQYAHIRTAVCEARRNPSELTRERHRQTTLRRYLDPEERAKQARVSAAAWAHNDGTRPRRQAELARGMRLREGIGTASGRNHKVVGVREAPGEHDVYCLTVPEAGNFALEAGVFVRNCGIIVNVTPLEPEWEGYVTLEFSNTTPLPAKIYANEGVAQVIFFESDEVCETSYKDRGGKYQGQKGVTLPKI